MKLSSAFNLRKLIRPEPLEMCDENGRRIEYPPMPCPGLSNFMHIDSGSTHDAKPSKPVLVKLGGQSGSGKSVIVDRIVRELSHEPGGVIHFDWDMLRPFKPDSFIRDLHKLDAEDLPRYRPDILNEWCQKIIAEALAEKRNFVLDGRLENAANTRSSMEDFSAKGYEIHAVVMAVHPLFCRIGSILRMAKTCVDLQAALDKAALLPTEERDRAVLAAQRSFFPRINMAFRDEEDTAFQLESLDELDRLIVEGKINKIELWERNRNKPSLSISINSKKRLIVKQSATDNDEHSNIVRKDKYKIGTASGFYRTILATWTSEDQNKLQKQIRQARDLLNQIRLQNINVPKYIRYLDEIETEGKDLSCPVHSPPRFDLGKSKFGG